MQHAPILRKVLAVILHFIDSPPLLFNLEFETTAVENPMGIFFGRESTKLLTWASCTKEILVYHLNFAV